MLQCAFRNDDINQYIHEIIRVIYEDMSDRSIATVLSLVSNFDYYFLYHEVYVCISTITYDEQRLADVRQRLEQCGLEHWRSNA